MENRIPLSLIDVESPVKRIFRVFSISAVNGCVAWFMFTRLRSVGFPAFDFQLWFEFVFEVTLPLIGIVLEAVNWKFARWVNVGCFAAAGIFWLAAAIWWRSDPFFGVLLIIGLGLLVVAGINDTIYRRTKSLSSA
jgi:hypothetical protein